MTFKRIAVALVAVLALGALVLGCKPKAAEKVVVKAMAYGDNSNSEGVNWVRIVKEFEKANPDIDIDYELLYDEAYHQKVQARLASGDVPHFAYMGADARWGAPWKEASQQVDHRPWIDTAKYDMKLIPSMGPNGEIYEIPLGTSNITTVMFMNKKLVEEMGFSAPKTYEDLVAMVPAAQERGIDVISFDGADGWAWGSCYMSAIIARLSGDANWVSKAVAGKNKFTDDVFVQSLSIIKRMLDDGLFNKNVVMVDDGASKSNFTNEKAMFMIQGQWAAGGIEQPTQDNTVLLAFPKLPGEKANMAGSVAAAIQVGYGLTKAGAADEKVRTAALKFIDYFYSTPETTQRLLDGAIVAPILKGYQIPAELPAVNVSKVQLAQRSTTQTDVIDAFLGGAANDALNAGMQKIAAGQATPEEVAAEVERLLRGN